ncbi:MAG: ATP-binding protein [Marinoscillum sp.]
MLKNLWRRYSFIGVDENHDHQHKIKVVVANQISLMMILIVVLILPVYLVFEFPPKSIIALMVPVFMSIAIPILNGYRKNALGSIIGSMVIPISVIVANVFIKINTPISDLSESEYFRSYLWLIISLIVPFLVIDSRRRLTLYCLLSLPFLAIFFTNSIYEALGVGFADAGYDPNHLYLYNSMATLAGFFVVMGLSSMNNLTKYYRVKMDRMHEKLLESEKMASIGVLTSGISHEINNPLNFIKGGFEIIRTELSKNENPLGFSVPESLNLIDEGVNRVIKIIKSLQHFSEGKINRAEQCDLRQILLECVQVFENEGRPKLKIQPIFHTDEILIYGDRSQMYHAFLNILTNAYQAIDDQGTISVCTSFSKDSIMITVKDNGVGIKPKYLPRVLEPFFTTRDPGQGVGMGLSIAYNIIKLHQGTLEIESQPNIGTRVSIEFPQKIKFGEKE